LHACSPACPRHSPGAPRGFVPVASAQHTGASVRSIRVDALVIRPVSLCVAYDFESLRKETTVRGQFVDDVLKAELPEDDRRAVLVTGLRALESRGDLDVV
jgi:hypothetical protein